MKTCNKCGAKKPIEEFYKCRGMADGHLNKCKTCTKTDVLRYRRDNIEKVRDYDRRRGKHPERIHHAQEVTAAWRAEDSRRNAAHCAVSRAIRSGRLVRQPCERCGRADSHAHHDDYNRKLDVRWLCPPCHKQRHKELSK